MTSVDICAITTETLSDGKEGALGNSLNRRSCPTVLLQYYGTGSRRTTPMQCGGAAMAMAVGCRLSATVSSQPSASELGGTCTGGGRRGTGWEEGGYGAISVSVAATTIYRLLQISDPNPDEGLPDL